MRSNLFAKGETGFRGKEFIPHLLGGNSIPTRTKASIWWKDVIGLERGFANDWFKLNVGCYVGDDNNIGFWKFKCFGNHSFKYLFPNLFAKEVFQDVMIAERLLGNGEAPLRSWPWNDQLSTNEE
jgi:hypothetical protein